MRRERTHRGSLNQSLNYSFALQIVGQGRKAASLSSWDQSHAVKAAPHSSLSPAAGLILQPLFIKIS